MLKRLLALAALFTVAGVAAATAQTGPIKIGAILPLTGSGASYGVWMKGGAEIATEEINAAGGIGGRKLEVIYEDHAADASKAVNIPVIGMGGISTAADIVEFMLAGASAVQIGTASYWDPVATEKIAAELDTILDANAKLTDYHRGRKAELLSVK